MSFCVQYSPLILYVTWDIGLYSSDLWNTEGPLESSLFHIEDDIFIYKVALEKNIFTT